MNRIKEFLFTGCYAGYSPIGPGTAGSLVGMAVYFLEYLVFGYEWSWIVNLGAIVVLFVPFMLLAGEGEKFFGEKDPGRVVIDEVLGYWISVMFFPFNLKVALAAFVIFRIMDILKPWPVNRLQDLKGGLGIMIDDCVAGLYTFIVVLGAQIALKLAGVNIY